MLKTVLHVMTGKQNSVFSVLIDFSMHRLMKLCNAIQILREGRPAKLIIRHRHPPLFLGMINFAIINVELNVGHGGVKVADSLLC